MKKILLLIIVCCVMSLNADDTSRLQFAQKLIQDKLFDEALNELDFISSNSQNSLEIDESKSLMAEIYLQQGLTTKAESIYLAFLANPSNKSSLILEKANLQLAQIYFKQNKYAQSLIYTEALQKDYASSVSAKQSIPLLLESMYQTEDYKNLISRSNELSNRYKNEPINAEILYYKALASLKLQLNQDTEIYLEQIINQFPDSPSANKVLELQVSILYKKSGLQSSIQHIQNMLSKGVNRSVEENLNRILLSYYAESQDYQMHQKTAQNLMEKFNLSDHVDYYALQWLFSNDKLKLNQAVLQRITGLKTIFYNSKYQKEANYFFAKAYLLNKEYNKALEIIAQDLPEIKDDALIFNNVFLKAEILKSQGQINEALSLYNQLLRKYAHLSRNDEVYYAIADLYFNFIEDYDQAEFYYQQAISSSSQKEITIKALYQTALCNEKQKDYLEAIKSYKRILKSYGYDLASLNTSLNIPINSIEQQIRKIYLFYLKDYDMIIAELQNQNPEQRNSNPVELIAQSAWLNKDFENTFSRLSIMSQSNSNQEMIRIKTALAYKAFLENNSNKYQLLKNEVAQMLNSVSNADFKTEINLFFSFIDQQETLSNDLIKQVELLLSKKIKDDTYSFKNFFKFLVSDYYYKQNNMEQFINTALSVKKDHWVNEYDFEMLGIRLGEAYYLKKDYKKSLEYFELNKESISMNQSRSYYQYAMSLYHNNNEEQAMKMIKRVVINSSQLASQQQQDFINARYFVTDHLVQKKQYSEVIDFLMMIPEKQRADKDYLTMSQVYQALGKNEQEKEAILHIKEKNPEMLRRLAMLYELNQEYSLAQYTWSELLRKETDPVFKAKAYFSLANISYNEGMNNKNKPESSFQEASKNYQLGFSLINPTLVQNQSLFSIAQISKNYVISQYKINNRPKAESLEKELSVYLNLEPDTKSEIKIHQAIYYLKLEPKKCEKILIDLISEKNMSVKIVEEAYLWRGICYLQQNKNKEAIDDFLMISHSDNAQIRVQAHLKLGNYYFTAEEFDLASQYYTSVIQNDSTGAYAFDAASNYALLTKITKEWEKAIQLYQMIIKRWGDKQLNSETQFNIAFCYFQAKLYDKSIQMFEQYYASFTSNELKAEALYWIAENYFSKEEYQQAVNAFLKVSYTFPTLVKWASLSELRAGESYLKNNQKDKAILTLKRVINVYGASSEAGLEAKTILDGLGVK